MEHHITCPHCGKTITDDPLIAAAVTGEGLSSQFITCECGGRITFWGATAQLREQKKLNRRIGRWFRGLFK
ncbi:MAG: hypothetical protein JXA21_11930 [Anaerolineae bacterium]|nr:hypothetical protein [Anaerolineae bacterium]